MKTALILIDLQKDFLSQLPADRAAAVIAGAGQLVEAARAAGAPVIWVKQVFKADLSDAFLQMRDKAISVVIEGTTGAQLADALVPAEGEAVVIKKRYSAFYGTDLDERLKGLGVEQVILSGINIHACIRMAALDAYQRDYRVVLPTGAMDGYDDAHNDITLKYLDGRVGRVVDLDRAMEALKP